MNCKKFLKPDWRKILIAIVIFVILINIEIIPIKIMGGWREFIQYVSLIFELTHTYYVSGNLEKVFMNIGLVILFLVISYLLSCFMIWVYDKGKKK